MSPPNLKKLATLEGGVAAVLCLIASVFSLWYIRYATNDDMLTAISDVSYWHDLAVRQGRISYYLAGPLAMLPYVFNDAHYLSAIRVLMWLLLVFAAAAFLAILFRNKYVLGVGALVISLMWSNSLNSHNFLVSYPFYIAFTAWIFILSLTLFVIGVRGSSKKYLALSIILLFLVLIIGGEIYFQYLPVITAGVLYFYFRAENKRELMFMSFLVGASILLALIIVVSFRILFPSVYSGNSILNFEFDAFIDTLSVLTAGLFPGFQAFLNREYLLRSPFEISVAFAISLAAFVFFVLQRKRLSGLNLTVFGMQRKWLIVAALLAAIFAPNVLISLTVKYQEWVAYGVTNYLYSSFSYIPIAFVIVVLLVIFASFKRSYIAFSAIVSILIFVTQLNNLYVGGIQRAASARWDLFDAAVQQVKVEEAGNPTTISLSDDFFDGIPQEYYWQAYALKKLGFVGDIQRGGNADRYFSYFPSFSLGAVLFVEADGFITDVFTGFACDALNPCYLNTSRGDVVDLIKTGRDGQVVPLVAGVQEKGVRSIKLTNPIPKDAILGISLHDFNGWRKDDVTIAFGDGVDDLEGVENGYWRWVRTPAKFVLNANSTMKIKMAATVTPVSDMVVSVRLNGVEAVYRLTGGEAKEIEIEAVLEDGENAVYFSSDVNPVRLNDYDPRLFSFVMTSLRIYR